MKFGLFSLMSLRDNPGGIRGVLSDTRRMVRLAEEIGFDAAWFAEHHFTNNSVSASPLAVAANMAAVTSRIRLGSAVLVLPLYHPLRLAQEIAYVDQVSDGRLVLGVGTGYQPFEFARYGTGVETRTEHFIECWDVLEQALAHGHVEYEGSFFSIPSTNLMMRPVQQPLPDLYVASSNLDVLRRLVPAGGKPFVQVGWLGSKVLAKKVADMHEVWGKAGFSHRPMHVAVQQYVHVCDTAVEALEAAERARFVARMIDALRSPHLAFEGYKVQAPLLKDEPPLEVFRDNLVIGHPHYVAERLIEEFRTLKPDYYNCFFQFGDMPIARAQRSLARFGSEVLPLIEKELGPLNQLGATEPALLRAS
ncbi:LLM class flavin-dependent oxidoreductase [Novosphingobium album (ex Liu et al. 2023)]|uniref:LLM class flavin-dependent oxidoreductase n=1 Tax=Novosphingobium album (ex Liu et al. 2023) TaxID=3031130 RepID=A0ABT5WXJ5_9SPHN|nr:LLM class flavin-dependent oxidoreductase [Novosphingobium album (ex Liu et al. 2023)]MDE8654607.1 LLM class flavin-dependent oxidoreductase [Novosphingobium album (ex Liu et al. 2023)]